MRGIANAQQARAIPLSEAVDNDGEQLDLIPLLQLLDATAKKRCHAPNLLAEGGQPVAPDLLDAAFANHEAALPIVATVEHDHNPAVDNAPEHLPFIFGAPRDAKPQYVHGRAQVVNLQAGLVTDDGMTAVCSDNEAGSNLYDAVGRPRRHAGNAAALDDHVDDLCVHQNVKGRIA